MNSLQQWIGKSETRQDEISLILAQRMAATLGLDSPKIDENLPYLWHWMFFQSQLPAKFLGRDGHPALGGFMPPAEGRNRMWAGGEFIFEQALKIGQPAQCISTISDVVEKIGRTGSLVFVTIEHKYSQHNQHCFTEYQNVVYKEATPPRLESEAAPSPQWQHDIAPNATLLFRYSAVTFNGHRIHYDYPYTTEIEGYDNLVVHGPMMATWSLNGFKTAFPDKKVRRFSYKGVRPTTIPQTLQVGGRIIENGKAEVWIANERGLIQQGTVEFD